MNIKKIIAKITAYAMILTCICNHITVFSANHDYTTEIDTLTGLGIITGYAADNYHTRQSITWNDYLKFILNMMSDTPVDGNMLDLAKAKGLISQDSAQKAYETVYYEDAISVAVRALGYRQLPPAYEKDDLTIASELKLTRNMSGTAGAKLNSDQMLVLLYQMLDVKLLQLRIEGGKTTYQPSDETVLSAYKKIGRKSGMVTANAYTSLYDADGGLAGYITIDDQQYCVSQTKFNDYLGLVVDYYYKTNQSELELVHIVPKAKQNTEITINADLLIGVDKKVTSITYLPNENSAKSVTKSLSKVLKVIYNGKAYPSYRDTDFLIQEGNIRLLDHNADGVFDVAFITSYELMVVSQYSESSKRLYGKYTSFSQLSLEDCELNKNLWVYYGGMPTNMSAVSSQSVVLVKRTISGKEPLIQLFVSKDSIEGPIGVYDAENSEVEVDGNLYRLNKGYATSLKEGDPEAIKLNAGSRYKFYLDSNGKIAAAELLASATDQYVLLYSLYLSEDDLTVAKYVDASNVHHVSEFASSVRVGVKGGYSSGDVYQALAGTAENIDPQVVQIRLDSRGKIKSILRPQQSSGTGDKTAFTHEEKQSMIYRSGTGPSSFYGKYYVTASTVIFATYDITSHSPEDFLVVPLSRNYLSDSETTKYTFTPYNVDEFGFTDMIFLEVAEKSKTLTLLVQKKNMVLDSDQEPREQLVGPVGNLLNVGVLAENTGLFKDIKKGDYVELTVNSEGRAISANILYSPATGVKYSRTAEAFFYSSSAMYYGTLSAIDYNKMRMKMYFGSGVPAKSFTLKDLVVTVYVYENGNVTIGNVNDLNVGDMLIVRSPYDKVSVIAVYKR